VGILVGDVTDAESHTSRSKTKDQVYSSAQLLATSGLIAPKGVDLVFAFFVVHRDGSLLLPTGQIVMTSSIHPSLESINPKATHVTPVARFWFVLFVKVKLDCPWPSAMLRQQTGKSAYLNAVSGHGDWELPMLEPGIRIPVCWGPLDSLPTICV